MTTNFRVLCWVLALSVSLPAVSRAEVSEQGGELYSIEKRNIMGSHEILLSLGTLPMDAFAKGLTLHGSYAYYFSQLIGWELVGGMWSFNFQTDLKQQLKDRFDVQPTEEGELRWILNSNFIFRPMYGKFALTNDKLFNGELFFVLGYALGGFTAAIPSGFDVGVALRLFMGRYFSIRLDIRDYIFLPDFKDVDNNLFISFGLSLTFGFSDDEEDQ